MRPDCNRCEAKVGSGRTVVRTGHYYRKSDSRWIQRYKCLACGNYFSSATFDPCFNQNKRRKNLPLDRLLRSGVSMRECSRALKIHRTTVQRKKTFLALQSEAWLRNFRSEKVVHELQFDDMETFEHSKCKPLSITLAVEKRTRLILGFKVASMPAKGLLARKSRKKYGFRPDHRARARGELFEELREGVSPKALIESDQNPHYEADVRSYFPSAHYETFKGRRGCVVGQGELKSGGFDPLFSLNHTCAMLRANINRLFRRTWCTTKKIRGLEEHIAIYSKSHNQRILEKLGAAT